MSFFCFPQIMLPDTDISVSRFVFGTASLFNAGNQRTRLKLLSAAVDAGFTHFDTAPYYGFGWAERDLGQLRKFRTEFSVTTKVGIYSPGGEGSSRAAVLLRKASGRVLPIISRPDIDFSLLRAQQSLAGSLSRLNAEHVKIYMLHEPDLALVATEEWQRWLENEVERGRIGAWGLALTADRLRPFLNAVPDFARLVQTFDSITNKEADLLTARGRPLQITFGYVSAESSAGRKRPVADILTDALARNSLGAIIVSTTKAERIGQYAQIIENLR